MPVEQLKTKSSWRTSGAIFHLLQHLLDQIIGKLMCRMGKYSKNIKDDCLLSRVHLLGENAKQPTIADRLTKVEWQNFKLLFPVKDNLICEQVLHLMDRHIQSLLVGGHLRAGTRRN